MTEKVYWFFYNKLHIKRSHGHGALCDDWLNDIDGLPIIDPEMVYRYTRLFGKCKRCLKAYAKMEQKQ